jgi:hypothetical protein
MTHVERWGQSSRLGCPQAGNRLKDETLLHEKKRELLCHAGHFSPTFVSVFCVMLFCARAGTPDFVHGLHTDP